MALQIPYISELPKAYQKAIESLNTSLLSAQDLRERGALFEAFYKKYTILLEFLEYDFGNDLYFEKLKNELRNKLLNDFPQYQNFEWPNFTLSQRKTLMPHLTEEERLDWVKSFFYYPHSQLTIAYQTYLEMTGAIVSVDVQAKYKASCDLYNAIQNVYYNDFEAWISALMLTKDLEYTVNNIECRLVKEPGNRKLWKAYIRFLENQNEKAEDVLKIYSRYCRFFISDTKMRTEYEAKIKVFYKKSKKAKFWIDLISIKADFGSMISAQKLILFVLTLKPIDAAETYVLLTDIAEKHGTLRLWKPTILKIATRYLKNIQKHDKYTLKLILKTTTFDNVTTQSFPFSNRLLNYISTNLSHLHLEKLYQTCKYFFHKHRLILVKNYRYSREGFRLPQVSGHTLNLSPITDDIFHEKKCWLTFSLFFNQRKPTRWDIFAKIKLESLYLYYVTLDYNEYLLLTESKTIKKLLFVFSRIQKESNNLASVAELLTEVPNAIQIIIYVLNNLQGVPALGDMMSLSFNRKLQYFYFYVPTEDSDLLANFCWKNVDNLGYINLSRYSDTFITSFHEKLNSLCQNPKYPQGFYFCYTKRAFDISYISELPKGYRKAVKALTKKVEKASTFRVKNRHFQSFADNYTLLPEIARLWKRALSEADESEIFSIGFEHLSGRKLADFPQHSNIEWPTVFKDLSIFLFYNDQKNIQKYEFLMSLPHSKLDITYIGYAEYIDFNVPKEVQEKYEKNCKIWKEISSVNYEDVEAWISALMLTNNSEYTVNNIECRLVREPGNRKLWMAYIQFLKDQKSDSKVFLKVLSRCCRLIVKDSELMTIYQKSLEATCENEDVSEFWIDLIKIKANFISTKAAEELLIEVLTLKLFDAHKFFYAALEMTENSHKLSYLKSKILLTQECYSKANPALDSYNFQATVKKANFIDVKNQTLPFQTTMLAYLYPNFNPTHLRKLYQTCKLFYFQFQVPLVFQLEVTYSGRLIKPKYSNHKMELPRNRYDYSRIKPFWLADSMILRDSLPPSMKSKIIMITLRCLSISTNIDYCDYLFLTASKTIEKLGLSFFAQIKKGPQENASLFEILKEVPNLINFDYDNNNVAFDGILDLKFNRKLQRMLLYAAHLNTDIFFEACKKLLAPKAVVHLIFLNAPNKAVMKEKFLTWEPKNERPEILYLS